MATVADLKKIACDSIDREADSLNELSQKIWLKPELGLEEREAHDILTKFLDDRGFKVQRNYKMTTAFRAEYGPDKSGPNIAVISEYDALPEIGHACGHNLIAEVGVAAGIGIQSAIARANKPMGKVTVLGTPAEEGYGGKIDLIKGDAFDDVDAAMMAHPFPDDDPIPIMFAVERMAVKFHGKASHAAAFPWEGVNALDGAIACYQSIACLRQQIKPSWRIHAIITNGGVKVNVIPEKAEMIVAVRTPTDEELKILKEKVVRCFDAAAKSSGCTMDFATLPTPYSAVYHNAVLTGLYEANLSSVAIGKPPSRRAALCGSTDMGNVSRVVPSIHPHYHIGGTGFNHTREFTEDAGLQRAQPYTLAQAKALAMTAIDLMMNPVIVQEMREEFRKSFS